MEKEWFLYILECKNGYLYTGITTEIKRRIFEHINGTGAKSLRGRKPIRLVYYEKCASQSIARKRELAIKNWKRENKIKLITNKNVNLTGFTP